MLCAALDTFGTGAAGATLIATVFGAVGAFLKSRKEGRAIVTDTVIDVNRDLRVEIERQGGVIKEQRKEIDRQAAQLRGQSREIEEFRERIRALRMEIDDLENHIGEIAH